MAKLTTKPKRQAAKAKPLTAKKSLPPAKIPLAVPAAPTVALPKVPSVWQLTKQSAHLLWSQKRLFAGITVVYGVLNVILAQGLAGSSTAALKAQLSQAASGHFSGLGSSLLVFGSLLTSAGSNATGAAGAYQLFLGLIVSLATIWALRQVVLGRQLRIRDAYYKGMSPLIPFVLVLLLIGVQLLPMALGSSIYAIVMSQGIAVQVYEKIIWATVFGLLSLWSLYMLSASVFGLYIVTLPDMTPIKALRSAKQLVRGRRWTVLRKLLFLPLLLLLLAAIIMLPFIILLTTLATYVFFILTTFSLVAVHGYLYNLYRELLSE